MKQENRGWRIEDCSNPAMRFYAILYLLSSILPVCTTGCRRDMFNQPSSQPLEHSSFFQDNHMASRPLPPHTVARGHLDEDEAFYTGKIGNNLVTTLPFPVTRELL